MLTFAAARDGESPDTGGSAAVTLTVDRHAPVMDSFTAQLVENTPLTEAQTVQLDWSGADPNAGTIKRYRAPAQGRHQLGRLQRRLTHGHQHRPADPAQGVSTFRVRAADEADNVSRTTLDVKLAVRDSTSSKLSWSTSGWTTRSKAKAYGGSFRRSSSPGRLWLMSFAGPASP